MNCYSPFLQTLHDESGPTGYLGRGTHYTVLRSLSWYDSQCLRLDEAVYHDFALIWDEDHDERIVLVVVDLYAKGLLAPLLFLGERKGMVTFITEGELPSEFHDACAAAVSDCTEAAGDPWLLHIANLGSERPRIIEADDKDVNLYLRSINMLWRLGCKSRQQTDVGWPPMKAMVQD